MAVSKANRTKRQTREKIAQLREQQRRADRRRKVITGVIVGMLAAAGIAAIAWAVASKNSSGAPAVAGVRSFSGLSRTHVPGKVSYPQTPPVGGNHNAVPLNCGIYTSPVPNENAVHSLEHGAVWVTYRPALPAARVTTLQNLVRGEPQGKRGYVILSPYPGLPAPVVASAWGKQLQISSATDPRLAQFITAYAQGPQTPEPGAACSGGVGTPQP